MNFEEFLNTYKEEALQIDLAKEYPLVFDILEREKIKLHNADFISEIDEVIKFSEKAVKETKELLKSAFINKHYKTTYIGEKPIFLSQIKIYFDYKLLYNEAIIIKNKSEQPQQDNEIDIYIKSYNQYHFDEVMIKRNEDGTPNNIYLGNNFNEWLTNIDRNLSDNKSYDAETQDKLSIYNKYLLFLAQDLIGLYKAVSGYKKTNNTGFITSIHIQENKILQRLDSIKFYAEIVKHYTRNKQFQKANDIKDYCIALFDNCVYNLNDVLSINVYKSPLKTHFEDVKTDLKNSINFEELKILTELSKSKFEKTLQNLNAPTLIHNESKTIKQFYKPIVFTLKEYESIYENRLFEHLKIHVDYDANHFVLDEKNNYEFYLNLIDSIGCVPDDMMNEKHKFPIINISDFDYNNLYLKEGAIDSFFYQNEENDKGYIVIEEIRPDVINVIDLFKNLTFEQFVFKAHNLKNSFRLIIKFLKKKRKGLNLNKIKAQTDLNVQIEHPQQAENVYPNEVKKDLHNHIFKDNAFTVWESMFIEFDVNESSRTDVKFMFEEMKKEGLIHKTVNQTTFLEWITLSYDGLIVQKTSNHNRSSDRLKAYSRAKELYKS